MPIGSSSVEKHIVFGYHMIKFLFCCSVEIFVTMWVLIIQMLLHVNSLLLFFFLASRRPCHWSACNWQIYILCASILGRCEAQQQGHCGRVGESFFQNLFWGIPYGQFLRQRRVLFSCFISPSIAQVISLGEYKTLLDVKYQ